MDKGKAYTNISVTHEITLEQEKSGLRGLSETNQRINK